MTPEEQHGYTNSTRAKGTDVVERMKRINDQLLKKLQEDGRIESGVPGGWRSSDLDFIQMTGLTRPPVESLTHGGADTGDEEALQALSFYEKGVADVDADMVPGLLEDESQSDREIATEPREPTPVTHLKDVIEELAQRAEELAEPDEVADLIAGADVEPGILGPGDEDEVTVQAEPSVQIEEPCLDAPAGLPHEGDMEQTMEEADHIEPEAPTVRAPVEIEGEKPPESAPDVHDEAPVAWEVGDEEAETPAPYEEASVVEAGTGAPPPMDLAEIAKLLQELQDQPREGREEEDGEGVQLVPSPAGVEREDVPVVAPERPEEIVSESREPDEDAMVVAPPLQKPEMPPVVGEPVEEFGEEPTPRLLRGDEVVYRRPLSSGRRRSRLFGRRRRKAVRWLSVVLVLLVVGFLTYQAFGWVGLYTASPEKLFSIAMDLSAQHNYWEASKRFAAFAARFPEHPLRPEAQFEAAFVLLSARPGSYAEPEGVYAPALALFEQYMKDNPTHNKVTRAQSLAGIVNFKLGRFEEAIRLLRDPELRLKDPNAAVSALRTLAQAYACLEQYDNACSAYLQAASMPGNYSPDEDYNELGALYKLMAERASDPLERRRFQELAIQHWDDAVRVPGIDPQSKQDIKFKQGWLRDQMAKTGHPTEDELGDQKEQQAVSLSEGPGLNVTGRDSEGELDQAATATSEPGAHFAEDLASSDE